MNGIENIRLPDTVVSDKAVETLRKFEGNPFIVLEVGEFEPGKMHHLSLLLRRLQSYEKKRPGQVRKV